MHFGRANCEGHTLVAAIVVDFPECSQSPVHVSALLGESSLLLLGEIEAAEAMLYLGVS